MFNAGVRGKRAKDGVGFLSTAEQFNQKSFLVPTVTSFSITDVSYVPLDNTAVDTAGGEIIVINGSGFAPGATVQVGATTIGSVTFIDQNRLAFTAPALSSGSYTIYVTNSNGGTGILLSGLVYSGLPTYTTTAGTLGTIYETANINTAVVATGDAPITYSVISGTLPSGATLNSNGTITGNAPVDGSSTTYSFTIQASDAQLQDSTRAFTLTISTDVLTWGLANNTVYSLDGGTTMSNVTLSATSSANSNSAVTFAANTLPTGVSLSGNTIFGTPTTEQTVYSTLTATATQTGRTATRFVSWVVSVSDLFFKYTTLAIQGADTTFVDDASTNNFAVTINGDTKPNSFNPYTPGYYSNYFDGLGDWLTIPNNTGFAFGSGAFTVEMWVNISGSSGTVANYSNGQSSNSNFSWELYQVSSTTIQFSVLEGATQYSSSSASFSLNKWNHIACVRNGNTLTIYVNGVAGGTTANLTGVTVTEPAGSTLKLCSYGNGSDYVTGYISNFRVVKGTAVYTTTFTPSTTPLTAISGTSVLTCQSNRFIDNSTNNFTLTVYGNTSINSFDPFVPNTSYSTYGSGYFDGTGDYLLIPSSSNLAFDTGDFCVEMWYYQPTIALAALISNSVQSGSAPLYGDAQFEIQISASTYYPTVYGWSTAFLTSSVASPAGRWNHIAVCRNGTTASMFLNGVRVATATVTNNFSSTNSFNIGRQATNSGYLIGYISNLRISKGSSIYDPTSSSITIPTAPLTAIANTSLLTLQNNQSVNNSTFLDNSTNNFLVTRAGNATQGTFSPYGGNWSNYFNGSSDYLTVPSNSAFAFGTGDFTVEMWVYHIGNAPNGGVNTDRFLFGGFTTSPACVFFLTNNALNLALWDGTTQWTSAGSVTPNTWNHIAYSRVGTNLYYAINGVVAVSTGFSTNFTVSRVNYIGRNDTAANRYFPGYISNLRVIKGTGLYTSNFTPSTTPLTVISGTSLLTCQSNRLIDNSINNFTITKGGDTSVQRFSPFNPSSVTPTSYSGYFDGTGDYLAMPSNATSLAMGTGNFTIEFWINTSNIAQTGYVLQTDIGSNSLYISLSGSTIRLTNAATVFAVTPTLSSNTWYHIAIVRSGTSSVIYTNGVAGTPVTCSIDFTQNGPTVGANSFVGYISNLRVVKGTAVYTENFTPSTTPLTAIANTSLLTLQSTTFIDNSTNNFTITAYGNSQPTIQNPFGFTSALTNGYTVSTIGGSGYFDGSGDHLIFGSSYLPTVAGTAFTLEFWIYSTKVISTYTSIIASGNMQLNLSDGAFTGQIRFDLPTGVSNVLNSGDVRVKANTWNHIVLTRTIGNNYTLYLNGVNVGTGSSGTAITTLSTFAYSSTNSVLGYISDLRVTNSLVYTANFVPPTAPLTAVQNSSLLLNMTGAGIYDAAMMNNLETVGDAKLSTAVSKFGGSSMSFDGTGDYLYIKQDNPALRFGTAPFTIECWVYLTSTVSSQHFFFKGSAGTDGIFFTRSAGNAGKLAWYVGGTEIITTSSALSLNQWTHIAYVRTSTSASGAKIYINGVSSGTGTDSTNYTNTDSTAIGAEYSGTNPMTGYIDDYRITYGYARYTSNFTPPTTTFKIK